MLTAVIFLCVLGILVFIHELGHFLLAKSCGVRVETFSLGFGPRLFGWTKGDTDYRISLIPLGGYVKMTGEDPADEDALETDSFAKQSVSARMKIVLAGPIMNLILPFLLMPLVFMIGIHQPAYLKMPTVIGWVEQDSPAAKAGLQIGDQITKIQDKEVPTWEQARITFLLNPKKTLNIEILRDSNRQQTELTPAFLGIGGYVGIRHEMPPVIGDVSPQMPAEAAGLLPGDIIISINGQKITHWAGMAAIIRAHPEEPLDFVIQRGQEQFTKTISPQREEKTNTGLLGIMAPPEKMDFIQHGLWDAIKAGVEIILETIVQTFLVLGKLVSGGLSMKTLGGPVKIAEMTGEAARIGLSSLIYFLAFLSLQLGILNLLPIPALDGGYVMFLSLEAILRKPVNAKAREIAQQVGFMVLIFFILIITYNDIMNLIPQNIKNYIKGLFNFL